MLWQCACGCRGIAADLKACPMCWKEREMPTITSGGASNQWEQQEPEAAAPTADPVPQTPSAQPQDDTAAAPQQSETQDAPTQDADAPPEPDAQAPTVEDTPQTVTPPPPPNPEGA